MVLLAPSYSSGAATVGIHFIKNHMTLHWESISKKKPCIGNVAAGSFKKKKEKDVATRGTGESEMVLVDVSL